jgi:hypothetical protein
MVKVDEVARTYQLAFMGHPSVTLLAICPGGGISRHEHGFITSVTKKTDNIGGAI